MVEHIKKKKRWYAFGLVALLGASIWYFQDVLSCIWVWLRETPNGYESGSTTVRNLGLIVAGLIALPLTLWRIRVADNQAKAAHQQVETSQNQVATSQGSLLNERYQKGAEMLGSGILSVRLGGIYALARLARENPEEYHVQIMRLFCAFVRNPTPDNKRYIEAASKRTTIDEILDSQEPEGLADLRLDIEAVMEAIAHRSKDEIRLEKDVNFHIDLREAKLQNLFWQNIKNVNLYRANLSLADLSGASFRAGTNLSWVHAVRVILFDAGLSDVNLTAASLWYANLTDALLINADLTRAVLEGANLSGTDLRGARGLTQEQLDITRADPDKLPILGDTLDADTGKPLVWHGRSLYDE